VHLDLPVIAADAVSGAGLEQALDGIDVAYFLIHSMETSTDGAFNVRERATAENFARAARDRGVNRVIYLGGPVPAGGELSPHLASRHEVENILLAATPCSVAFRASIVIGAHSRSFRFLVRLIERMPVLAVPAWRNNRSAPIDERDMIELLARAAVSDQVCGQSLDAGGRDVVSYGELIDRIRDHMLVNRPTIGLHRLTVTPIASRIASVIAGEDPALIGPLMESLERDLLPRDNRAAELLGVRLHSLDAAIERALRDWEATEPLAAR
jgi:nucleoside-diphosphate-sugar epimerase